MMNNFRRAWFRHGRHGGRDFFGGPFGRDWAGWGGRRARPLRRGDMKFVLLELLAEGPKHGYELIGAIEQRRNTRPSAGSVYPTLQMLEDGGFVTSAQDDGKRVYTITEAGRTLLAERGESPDDEEDDAPDTRHDLGSDVQKLLVAVMGAQGSSDETLGRIREVVDRARKDVYKILSDDDA